MAQFIKVASTADLAPGTAKCVEVAGKKIALFSLEGSFYAIDDTCTHRGGPLSEGDVSGEEVTCPWHGAVHQRQDRRGAGLAEPRDVVLLVPKSARRSPGWCMARVSEHRSRWKRMT